MNTIQCILFLINCIHLGWIFFSSSAIFASDLKRCYKQQLELTETKSCHVTEDINLL